MKAGEESRDEQAGVDDFSCLDKAVEVAEGSRERNHLFRGIASVRFAEIEGVREVEMQCPRRSAGVGVDRVKVFKSVGDQAGFFAALPARGVFWIFSRVPRTAWQIVDPTVDGVSVLPSEDHGVLGRGNQDGDGEGDALVDFEGGLLAAWQLDAVLRNDDPAFV